MPRITVTRRGGRIAVKRALPAHILRRRAAARKRSLAARRARALRLRRPAARRVVRRRETIAGRPVVARPEEFYSMLAKASNSYQPGIQDKTRFDFFTLTPDPEKQYGNYSKSYIEMPANIQGVKVEFYPTNPQEEEGTTKYRTAINTLSEGVLTLYVNDQPVAYWRVDDVAHSYSVDPWYDGTSGSELYMANLILNDQPFTIMKDLIESKVVKTRGRDRIYASIQIASALAAANVPTDFKIKCSLLIRPKRLLFT